MSQHCYCDVFDTGADVVAHQVNCQGVMGSGVAKQVRDRFPDVYKLYRKLWHDMKPHALLGMAQLIPVSGSTKDQKPLMIANLFGQLDYGWGLKHTDYGALQHALHELAQEMRKSHLESVALPYGMGCVRGGGDWDLVLPIIERELKDFKVFICQKENC